MSEGVFFFDTYAFFEILRKNPSYEKYVGARPITTIFNLAELNHGLKRDGKKYADEMTRKNEASLVEVGVEDVIHAIDFRLKFKSRNVSIPDSIGYVVAKRHGTLFLTGDQAFKDLPNVEFVK
ncbi:MAG: PIN domain-containing protein [Candidatus Diapherotrites archaeon]|nr:PIN domain-containing protein [Candidatus Diapherotrites archaeon]